MGCGCNGSSGYQTSQTLDCGCGCGGLKKSDYFKMRTSFQAALLFFVVANPWTFKLTSKLVQEGTQASVLLHSVVFFVLTFLIMKISLPSPY